MLDRIKEILVREGFSSGSFADEIGVQRSSLSHILNGRNNPSLDFMLKVLQRFPRLNSDWLLLGEGEMYNHEEPEIELHSEASTPPDLFSSVNTAPTLKVENDIPKKQVEPATSEEIKIDVPKKYVSQILIFYSDSTYQIFKPEKPEI